MQRKLYNSEELSQRSPEWLTARMGRFTSSQIHKLFTAPTKKEKAAAEEKNIHCFSKGAKTYILEKASEFIYPQYEFKYQSASMEWGMDNESFALEEYQRRFKDFTFQDVSFVELGNDNASSPDLAGLFKDIPSGVEVKCPSQLNHVKNILNVKTAEDLLKYYPAYFYQCHHQIWCCNFDFVDWCSFHPHLQDSAYSEKALHVVRIFKDEAIIKQFEKVTAEAAILRNQYIEQILS
jgi:hypothetical protein